MLDQLDRRHPLPISKEHSALKNNIWIKSKPFTIHLPVGRLFPHQGQLHKFTQ